MLGEDDWFDNISAAGRDQFRFAHTLKLHTCTAKRKEAILEGMA